MILRKIQGRKADMTTLSNTLTEAMAIAQRAGAANAGAEHLMMAALAMDDGTARQAFEAIDADPDGFAAAVEAALAAGLPDLEMPEPVEHEPVDGRSPVVVDLPLPTTRMTNVDATFESAIKATHYFHNLPEDGRRLCGAYFVAGIASIEHGVAARALSEMEIDAAGLISAAKSSAV